MKSERNAVTDSSDIIPMLRDCAVILLVKFDVDVRKRLKLSSIKSQVSVLKSPLKAHS